MHALSITIVVLFALYLAVVLPKAWWLWKSRDVPLIRARFPGLILSHTLTMILTTGVILLGEVRRLEEATFSCAFIVVDSWVGFRTAGLAFILRGVKMVVATSGRETREKYRYVINPKWAWRMVIGSSLSTTPLIIAVIVWKPFVFTDGPDSLCYMFQPWVFAAGTAVAITGLVFAWVKAVYNSNDDLLVGQELLISFSGFGACTGSFFVFRMVSDLSHSFHTTTSINLLFAAFCAVCPVVGLFWWGDLRWIRDPRIRKQMLKPRLGGGMVNNSNNNKVCPETALASRHNVTTLRDGSAYANTRDILACTEMSPLFEDFLRRAICVESLEFLRAVEKYDAALVAAEGEGTKPVQEQEEGQEQQEQLQQQLLQEVVVAKPRRGSRSSLKSVHAMYVDTCRKFIQQFSDMEVNIHSNMRVNTMRLMDAAVFCGSDKLDSRRSVFGPAVGEVYALLDSNFLAKFKTTPEYLETLSRMAIEQTDDLARDELATTVDTGGDGVDTARRMLLSSMVPSNDTSLPARGFDP